MAIKNHVPTKTISGRWNLPWITPGLRRLMRKKQRVYNLAKRMQIRNIGRNLKSYGKPGQARRIHHLLERNFGPTSSPKEKTMWALVL